MPRKRAKPPEKEENNTQSSNDEPATSKPAKISQSERTEAAETTQTKTNPTETTPVSATSQPSQSTDSYTFTVTLPKKVVWTAAVFVGVLAVALGGLQVYLRNFTRFQVNPEIYEDLGVDGIVLFRRYDRDDDWALDIEEFEPLAHHLLEISNSGKLQYTYENDSLLNETDEILTVHSSFQPLVMDTMNKDLNTYVQYGLDSLVGLRKWQTANKEWENFAARQFAELFMTPKDHESPQLAFAYPITTHFQSQDGRALSTNRYYPSRLMGKEITIHRLLAIFHPTPFVIMRFPPQGGAATVRAYNDEYLDIVFRIHAEFQLNDPPFYPFWFTPAQFMGQIIISRDGKHVERFNMLVPTGNLLNVDMEWMNGPRDSGEAEVDIGFMPQMELKASSPSHPAIMNGIDMRHVNWNSSDIEDVSGQIVWTEEVDLYQATRSLETHFYPFKKVEYFNLTYAATEAQRLNRPIHHIALWGALDDQSC